MQKSCNWCGHLYDHTFNEACPKCGYKHQEWERTHRFLANLAFKPRRSEKQKGTEEATAIRPA